MTSRALPNVTGMPQILLQLSRIATEEHVSLDSVTPQTPIAVLGLHGGPDRRSSSPATTSTSQGFLQQLLQARCTTSKDGVTATGRLYDVLGVTLAATSTPPKVTATITLDAFYYTPVIVPTDGPATTTTTTTGRRDGRPRRGARGGGRSGGRRSSSPSAASSPGRLVGFQLSRAARRRRSLERRGAAAVGCRLRPAARKAGRADARRSGAGCRAASTQLAPRDLFVPQVSAGRRRARRRAPAPPPEARPPCARRTSSSRIRSCRRSRPVGARRTARRDRTGGAPARRRRRRRTSAPAARYIVVLGAIAGNGPASRKAAARAVVAAKNAGLKDVVANDAVPADEARSRLHGLHRPVPDAGGQAADRARARAPQRLPGRARPRGSEHPGGGF